MTNHYFGTYYRFDTPSKKEAAALLGADNLVGDAFSIEFVMDSGANVAWLKNKFGQDIGFFDAEFSRKLSIAAARGWTIKAFLSFVAYTDRPAPGFYWGEMAVMCFDPSHEEAFSSFGERIANLLAEGVRPDINLGEQGVSNVMKDDGSWVPSKRVALPEKEVGTAIMKKQRKASEKLIEQGRKGNKGCYLVSWAFLAALVVALLITVKSCGAF